MLRTWSVVRHAQETLRIAVFVNNLAVFVCLGGVQLDGLPADHSRWNELFSVVLSVALRPNRQGNVPHFPAWPRREKRRVQIHQIGAAFRTVKAWWLIGQGIEEMVNVRVEIPGHDPYTTLGSKMETEQYCSLLCGNVLRIPGWYETYETHLLWLCPKMEQRKPRLRKSLTETKFRELRTFALSVHQPWGIKSHFHCSSALFEQSLRRCLSSTDLQPDQF